MTAVLVQTSSRDWVRIWALLGVRIDRCSTTHAASAMVEYGDDNERPGVRAPARL